MRTCNAAGCGERTTRFGHFCHAHMSHKRRHGHPEQRATTKAALAPFIRTVEARIDQNPGNLVWEQCQERWAGVLRHAHALLSEEARGVAGNRWERAAAREVARLGEDVAPDAIMKAALAMFVMDGTASRSFAADEGFNAQLTRRIRGLSELNAGVWYNHATGKTKRAYRDVPPRVMTIMARWFRQAFGSLGLHLAQLEERDRLARLERASSYTTALSELQ